MVQGMWEAGRVIDANRISPQLAIGSAPPPGTLLARIGVQALVLCASDYQVPASSFPGVEVHHAGFLDDPFGLANGGEQIALTAAKWAADRMLSGRQVLVTCRAGINRSGLVSVLALWLATGTIPSDGVATVRNARPGALTNRAFVNYLNTLSTAGECDLCEAQLLTPRIYDDELAWAASCVTCKVPMIVLRRHSLEPTVEEARKLEDLVRQLKRPGQRVDVSMNTIPDHLHLHLRDA